MPAVPWLQLNKGTSNHLWLPAIEFPIIFINKQTLYIGGKSSGLTNIDIVLPLDYALQD